VTVPDSYPDGRSPRHILGVVSCPEESARAERRSRWIGIGLFAGIWLVFLLSPLIAAATHGDTAERIVGVTCTILFAVGYIGWLGYLQRRQDGLGWGIRPGSVRLRYCVAVIVTLSAFALATVPAAGPASITFLVFIVTTAIVSFGPRTVFVAGGSALVICLGLYLVFPSSHDAVPGGALGVVLASVAMRASWKLSVRGRQLEAARAEMTNLAVAAERERMARDLHDILGHSLTVIAMKSELAGRLIDSDSARSAVEITDIERIARQSLADVRATINGSRDVNLAAEIVNARTALAAAGISARLPNALDDIPVERSELFGWIVREAVTNVVRHSAAAECTVTVSANSVEVLDDGIGLADPDPAGGDGRGLHGLQNRVEEAGGSLLLGRGHPGGLRLRVDLPPLVAGTRPTPAHVPAESAVTG
jgi:two-component system sensor histidine kinase DesK